MLRVRPVRSAGLLEADYCQNTCIGLKQSDDSLSTVKSIPSIGHIALEIMSPLAAAAASASALWMVSARFEQGATWSGLNPDGGGPGFLLLLPAGVVSLFIRSRWVRGLATAPGAVEAAVGAAFCGVLFYAAAASFTGLSSDEVIPLASGVAGSFFVPRVVAAVLNDTWSRADAAAVGGSQA